MKAIKSVDPLSTRIHDLQLKLNSINTQIKCKITSNIDKEEEEVVSKIKADPKFFYSYAKKSSKVKCKVGPLKNEMGNFEADPKKIADLLQKQFCSVFSNPQSSAKKEPDFRASTTSFDDFDFTVEDILKAIELMKYKAAPGEDEIPTSLFKECKFAIAYPLFLLWRLSYNTGVIHKSFLSQLITPVFKEASKFNSVNYRPVSLTSHVIKIFERVLQKKLLDYLESNGLLSCNQHGFRKGCSCLSELLAHFNHLYENLANNHDSDTVYLDFSKAFDKVDHELLLKKLTLYGIKGKVFSWIKSFISNRVQKVVIEGEFSIIEFVISGVPQGTVLGPLLFLIFVNDMTLSVEHSELKMFADDSRLIKAVHPTECTDLDHSHLQSDIENVVKWSLQNNMSLNVSKFQQLSHKVHVHARNVNMRLLLQLPFAFAQFSRSHQISESYLLELFQSISDLGVSVSNDFSFEEHLNQIAKKANLKCLWVLSVFKSRSSIVLLTA